MQVRKLFFAKLTIFAAGLVPFGLLVSGIFAESLGANPVETITHETGDWALYFLLLTLAMTPLRDWTGNTVFVRFRRMLGLFAFFYALLHFSTWLVFDHFFDWAAIQKDTFKRPYITVGFAAFILLIPLAVTSTNGMMKRLGKRWKQLHQLVYVIGVLVILHYLWLVKADTRDPIIFGSIFVALLLHRVWKQRFAQRKQTRPHAFPSTQQPGR